MTARGTTNMTKAVAKCPVNNKTIDNSAAYINSWLKKFKDDSKMVILAAAQAQKASDFILCNNVD